MFDAIFPSEALADPQDALERAEGEVRLEVRRRGAESVLAGRYERGSLKARAPTTPPGEAAEIVLLNTAGGIAGGDRFATEIAVEAGAAALVTTQAAEKVYRSTGADATVATRLVLGPGARLDWLPQATILFDRARLVRALTAELAADASLLALEAIVLGRVAMGERVASGRLIDSFRIRRGGRLVLADALRLDGPIQALLAGPATLGGGAALATVLQISPGVEARLAAARAVLDDAGHPAGACVVGGVLVARLVANDGAALHGTVVRLLAILRDARTPPRVWSL